MVVEPGPDPDLTVATLRVADQANALGAQTGDAYQRLAGELNGFLIRTVRDPDVAADLLSDAFTRLLVEERAGRWPDQPRAWLYRVASNLAMSRGRHLQVVARVDRSLQGAYREPKDASADVEVLRRERRGDLDRALEQLTTDARTALLLAAAGFDGREISDTIGRSEAATRTLLCRSRLRLRELLAGIEP
jgi:RNA polymerase sigma-70 factor (ECF subfamily)